VWQAHVQDLDLRSQGLTLEQARELMRPAMWTPPTWPRRKPSATRKPAATPSADSPSTPPTTSQKAEEP
jgi:hypothetical protein